MSSVFACVAALGLAFAVGVDTPAAEPSAGNLPRAEGFEIKSTQIATVSVFVHTGETPLVIPYCSTDEGKNQRLCGLGTTLEVRTSRGWVPAQTPKNGSLLGGLPLMEAKVTHIPPNGRRFFIFEFAPSVFVVEPGQELRVVIDAWEDEASLRNGKSPTRLPTGSFRCPEGFR